jgi:ubiquinone/menaquinone biosynthesis C-methylase UbiE
VIWLAGGGANSKYLADIYTNSQITGIDLDDQNVEIGNKVIKESGTENLKLYQGDWYNLDIKWKNKFDGIISFQTLSWLPEYNEALSQLAKLNPEWIAVSSLFYEGEIEYTNKLKDYYGSSDGKTYVEYYYNIYSIPHVRQCFKKLGYSKFEYIPYEIDIDLPKQDSMDIGTYTIKTETGKRLQISAAMMLPWYFIVASK